MVTNITDKMHWKKDKNEYTIGSIILTHLGFESRSIRKFEKNIIFNDLYVRHNHTDVLELTFDKTLKDIKDDEYQMNIINLICESTMFIISRIFSVDHRLRFYLAVCTPPDMIALFLFSNDLDIVNLAYSTYESILTMKTNITLGLSKISISTVVKNLLRNMNIPKALEVTKKVKRSKKNKIELRNELYEKWIHNLKKIVTFDNCNGINCKECIFHETQIVNIIKGDCCKKVLKHIAKSILISICVPSSNTIDILKSVINQHKKGNNKLLPVINNEHMRICSKCNVNHYHTEYYDNSYNINIECPLTLLCAHTNFLLDRTNIVAIRELDIIRIALTHRILNVIEYRIDDNKKHVDENNKSTFDDFSKMRWNYLAPMMQYANISNSSELPTIMLPDLNVDISMLINNCEKCIFNLSCDINKFNRSAKPQTATAICHCVISDNNNCLIDITDSTILVLYPISKLFNENDGINGYIFGKIEKHIENEIYQTNNLGLAMINIMPLINNTNEIVMGTKFAKLKELSEANICMPGKCCDTCILNLILPDSEDHACVYTNHLINEQRTKEVKEFVNRLVNLVRDTLTYDKWII